MAPSLASRLNTAFGEDEIGESGGDLLPAALPCGGVPLEVDAKKEAMGI